MHDRAKKWFAIAAPLAALAAVAALSRPGHVRAENAEPRWYDQYRNRDSVPVKGTLWDFYKKNKREMDPDFNLHGPKTPKGEYCGIMKAHLDGDQKPVFSSGGFRIDHPWTNMDNSPIMWPKPFVARWPGDIDGALHESHGHHHHPANPADAVTPEEDVEHWWRDDPSSNETYDAPITFVRTFAPIGPPDLYGPKGKDRPPNPPKPKPEKRDPPVPAGSGEPPEGQEAVYVFDSLIPKAKKKPHAPKGQPKPPKPEYKPVNDTLGNIASGDKKKKRYTFEAETTFIFEKGTMVPTVPPVDPKAKHHDHNHKHDKPGYQMPPDRHQGFWLSVEAMDDVWVYIDGKLVIDLGGAYKGKEKREFCSQVIELDRLGFLRDGGCYSIKVFVADRDKYSEKSHLRIKTNIPTLGLVGTPTLIQCD